MLCGERRIQSTTVFSPPSPRRFIQSLIKERVLVGIIFEHTLSFYRRIKEVVDVSATYSTSPHISNYLLPKCFASIKMYYKDFRE